MGHFGVHLLHSLNVVFPGLHQLFMFNFSMEKVPSVLIINVIFLTYFFPLENVDTVHALLLALKKFYCSAEIINAGFRHSCVGKENPVIKALI